MRNKNYSYRNDFLKPLALRLIFTISYIQQAFEFQTLSNPELTTVQLTAVIYPNPTTDYLKLAFNIKEVSDVQINIINVAGQIVANNKYTRVVGAQTLPLNVSGFSVGFYTVELLINGEVISKQFVKQ